MFKFLNLLGLITIMSLAVHAEPKDAKVSSETVDLTPQRLSLDVGSAGCRYMVYSGENKIAESNPFGCPNLESARSKMSDLDKALGEKLIHFPAGSLKNGFNAGVLNDIDLNSCRNIPSMLKSKYEQRRVIVGRLEKEITSTQTQVNTIRNNWKATLDRQRQTYFDQQCLGKLPFVGADNQDIKAKYLGYNVTLNLSGETTCSYMVWKSGELKSQSAKFPCKPNEIAGINAKLSQYSVATSSSKIGLPEAALTNGFQAQALDSIDLKNCEMIPNNLRNRKTQDDKSIAELESTIQKKWSELFKAQDEFEKLVPVQHKAYYDQHCGPSLPFSPHRAPVVENPGPGDRRESHGSR